MNPLWLLWCMKVIDDHCKCGPESTFESRHLKSLDNAIINPTINTENLCISLKKNPLREVRPTWSLISVTSEWNCCKIRNTADEEAKVYFPDPASFQPVTLHVMRPVVAMIESCWCTYCFKKLLTFKCLLGLSESRNQGWGQRFWCLSENR